VPTNERGYEVPTLATDAVVLWDGQVLLVERGNDPLAGSWALPGGFVEVGETVEQACLRELREETDVDASIAELVGVYSDPSRDPRGHIVSCTFRVEVAYSQGRSPRAGDDAADVAWFDVHDPPPLAFDHGEILADALAADR
jgi:8-oxo-dGTP diphosphatase